MKSLEEIKESGRVIVDRVGVDGGIGIFHTALWRGSVIWSFGDGWDHVSVAPFQHRITPSWDDMCLLRDVFFKDYEPVIQIHPPKKEYVNNMPNCLHLWRYQGEMVLPPSYMVGLKQGESMEEMLRKAHEYE